ncbi:WD repeat domain 78 [Thecamonas trahens ATCC 50062]|uniref:Dynein axonemal intermediate chain 4 n=1 Tax=Thecamonas trahens ATCC 50062 TaxID=461836 RepID=A0A0L0DEE4_THETB|nr:WD repeat domain 78 [Thecamonas trahens ATCC 50062]KNC50560.1 WD repeat domain 78 [Thecamonas trahens ATCC 50062]|eukprot:XP_013762450.1 WD repeat domain 78 [Thecamonas trahens ATCC 50062]
MSTFASGGEFTAPDPSVSAYTQLQFGMDASMLESQSSMGSLGSSASSLSDDPSANHSVSDAGLGATTVSTGGGIVVAGNAEVEVIRSKRGAAHFEPAAALTRDDLDAVHTITLSETETFVMLDFAARVVQADSDEAAAVLDRNARYEALKKARVGSDAYSSRGVQTYNRDLKSKEVQKDPPLKKTAGTQVTGWSIHDEAAKLASTADADADEDDPSAAKARHAEDAFLEAAFADDIDDDDDASEVGGDLSSNASITESGSRSSMDTGSLSAAAGGLDSSGMGSMANATMTRAAGTSTRGGSGQRALPGLAGVAAMSMEQRAKVFMAKQARVASLADTLRVVERVVTQNIFHWRQLEFRGMPLAGLPEPVADDDSDLGDDDADRDSDDELFRDYDEPAAVPQPSLTKPPSARVGAGGEGADGADPNRATSLDFDDSPAEPSLKLLWRFECDATAGRAVTCMGWNPRDSDLLAVGYGAFNGTAHGASDGLVLCWSLKNVFAPERTIRLPSGVTALDTSVRFPNLLAVGLFSGAIAVYDLQTSCDEPIFSSGHIREMHRDPVWQLQWVDLGMEKGERLVSVSTDGTVKEWSIKKGLEFQSNLMSLSRVANPAKTKAGDAEVSVWRHVGGLAMAFSPVDPTTYLVGTENGNIHRCSSSYNEQYLASYSAHVGPVYTVTWSPFAPNIFLSSSTDWSVKLWDVNAQAPLVDFRTCADATNDVAWSPLDATLFATANNDGTLQIWDLSLKDYLDPLITLSLGSIPPAAAAAARPSSAATGLLGRTRTGPAAAAAAADTGPSATGVTSGTDAHGEPAAASGLARDDIDGAELPPKIATAVVFARNDPVVLCGNSVGQVEVFRLSNLHNAIRVDDSSRSMFNASTTASNLAAIVDDMAATLGVDAVALLSGSGTLPDAVSPAQRARLQTARLDVALEANARR